MAFVLIENNIVIQKEVFNSHNNPDLIEVDDSVECGFIQNSDGSFTKPDRTLEERMFLLRAERDSRLSETDWRMLSDVNANNTEWIAYRQALRDIPNQNPDPQLNEEVLGEWLNVNWPTPPST